MKGIIYEIKCNETNEIYIGSTTQSIKQRMKTHRRDNICISKQIIERNNYSVNILEELEFIDIKDLRIREQYYIDTTICINKINSYRSYEESLEYQKEYYEINKNEIKDKMKEYHEANKDKIKEYMKEYSQVNKDKIKAYKKQYYQNKIKSNNI